MVTHDTRIVTYRLLALKRTPEGATSLVSGFSREAYVDPALGSGRAEPRFVGDRIRLAENRGKSPDAWWFDVLHRVSRQS